MCLSFDVLGFSEPIRNWLNRVVSIAPSSRSRPQAERDKGARAQIRTWLGLYAGFCWVAVSRLLSPKEGVRRPSQVALLVPGALVLIVPTSPIVSSVFMKLKSECRFSVVWNLSATQTKPMLLSQQAGLGRRAVRSHRSHLPSRWFWPCSLKEKFHTTVKRRRSGITFPHRTLLQQVSRSPKHRSWQPARYRLNGGLSECSGRVAAAPMPLHRRQVSPASPPVESAELPLELCYCDSHERASDGRRLGQRARRSD